MAQVKLWYPKVKSAGDIVDDIKGGQGDLSALEGFAYTFVDNVGHASLLLDGLSDPTYVSWWPKRRSYQLCDPVLPRRPPLRRGQGVCFRRAGLS